MVLKELTLTVYTLEYVVVLKEMIFYNFFLGRAVLVLKELILTIYTLGG